MNQCPMEPSTAPTAHTPPEPRTPHQRAQHQRAPHQPAQRQPARHPHAQHQRAPLRGLASRAALCALLSASLVACGTPQTAGHYARTETRMLQQVVLGQVVTVREVVLEATPTGHGTAAGAVLGSVPGLQQGHATRAAVGGVLGSLLGQAVENRLGQQAGLEILVRQDDGALVAVTQETDGLDYSPGQRVRVLTLNGMARVVHHPAPPAQPGSPAGKLP